MRAGWLLLSFRTRGKGLLHRARSKALPDAVVDDVPVVYADDEFVRVGGGRSSTAGGSGTRPGWGAAHSLGPDRSVGSAWLMPSVGFATTRQCR